MRRGTMAVEISPVRASHQHQRAVPSGRDINANEVGSEIGALRAENAELRKVVIALSRLVIRNVLRNDARV
jgi:hypothetical protein